MINSLRAIKKSIAAANRFCAEFLGVERFSKPALYDLDERLKPYLGHNGFFIECGANDGFAQSNTYYLERFRGWRGLLIEPIPELYLQCKSKRSASICVNAALTGPDYVQKTITMMPAGLMSVAEGAFNSNMVAQSHVVQGLRVQRIAPQRSVRVPAITLSRLLDDMEIGHAIDFLSLDVEGSEENVLRGLDLARHRPKFILVEARDQPRVSAILGERYVLLEQMTHHDFLFKSVSG